MTSVERHYATHLAPIYEWIAGGAEPAFAVGRADLEGLWREPGFAVDLGAGFGMHAVPLARAGFRVLAVDSSELLTGRLRKHARGLPVEVVAGDLVDFRTWLPTDRKPDLIVCLGDTLTHLPDAAAVGRLAANVAKSLAPGGRFVATFRDYSAPPRGDARFIPVRADERRLLTCFLEELPDRVRVHDLVQERGEHGWTTTVSSYEKLRLAPAEARAAWEAAGMRTTVGPGPRGMIRLTAE